MRRQAQPNSRHDLPDDGRPASNPEAPARATRRSLVVGLEILEHLANCPASPTVSAISEALNIPRPVVYRSIMVLEQRGYIIRDGNEASYLPARRLFQLQLTAMAHQRLLAHAKPVMQSLSDRVSQSCNLAIPSPPDVQVVARQESSGPFGINVPMGFRYDVPSSAPGLVFAAFTRHSDPDRWPQDLTPVVEARHWSGLKKAVQRIADAGFSQVENPYMPDVIDLSCPIFEKGEFIAALTVPYIKTSGGANLTWCLAGLQLAAEQLNDTLNRDALAA